MVSSKKVHCAYCQQKCSGSVLRFQDQYYHKQCFKLLQSESAAAAAEEKQQIQRRDQISNNYRAQHPESTPELYIESATTSENNSNLANDVRLSQQQLHREPVQDSNPPKPTNEEQQYYHSLRTSKTTTTTTLTSHKQPKYLGDEESSDGSDGPARAQMSTSQANRAQTLTSQGRSPTSASQNKSATLPNSKSITTNGFPGGTYNNSTTTKQQQLSSTLCAGCKERILDGQALIALDLHWHIWCFKCSHCKVPLHGEYVAKDGKAYCERDYQKLFGITCVYCKRYITGKVLQAGEAHHFHPSCARCSKCGDPFVPGEEMYLQGEVTWHPRCGPGPGGLPQSPSQMNDSNSMMAADSALESTRSRSQLRASRAQSPSLSSRSRSASPYSYMSRQQYERGSPAFTENEPVGDLSRIYTISYLNSDPNQGYLRRPLEPYPPKSPSFSRPTSLSRIGGSSDRSRCSSRSQQAIYTGSNRDKSSHGGMYSVLSGMGRSGTSSRARSPSMMNEEAIQLAAYPSGQKPEPDSVPKIERDDFPAPPFPYTHGRHQHRTRGQSAPRSTSNGNAGSQTGTPSGHNQQQQERTSRPRSREFSNVSASPSSAARTPATATKASDQDDDLCSTLSISSNGSIDPRYQKEEQELSKIANGIGKIFLQTLKEREKLRAWKRANLDPRNASRTPSATRELPSRPLRYDNPMNASPSRDLDRPRPAWDMSELSHELEDDHSPTRARSPPSRINTAPQSAASSTYGYKVIQANRSVPRPGYGLATSTIGTGYSGGGGSGLTGSVLNGASDLSFAEQQRVAQARAADLLGRQPVQPGQLLYGFNRPLSSTASSAHLRRSMPNVAHSRDSALGNQHRHLDGPPKLYPYHLLATTNYRLPSDVDRCHLERHLSNEEFQYIFHCDRLEFYRLPEWKRNELKRRAKLF